MSKRGSPSTAARKRSRSRGTVTMQTLFFAAGFLGCFLVPTISAMRDAGKRISDESERGHDVMLTQSSHSSR